MALPPFLTTLMPKKSAIVLKPFKHFISQRGQLVSKIAIVIIAFYLIYKGGCFFI